VHLTLAWQKIQSNISSILPESSRMLKNRTRMTLVQHTLSTTSPRIDSRIPRTAVIVGYDYFSSNNCFKPGVLNPEDLRSSERDSQQEDTAPTFGF
jgi:hypothetical protein